MTELWQVDEPTADELRQRVHVVLRNMSGTAAAAALNQAGVRVGPVCDLSHAELEEWHAALTKPLETTR